MTLNAPVHKKILLQILADVYSNNTIAPFLGFKGGTAAYLFYGLNRFSVDLDFDLLDESKQEYVFEKLKNIIGEYGTIKEARMKRYSLIFILSYDQKEKYAQNIKIEVNLRDFGSAYELKSYMGISMLVMKKEDMFANKLVAMYERGGSANRDIFDVYYFAKNNWDINEKIVEKRVNMPFRDFLKNIIAFMESFNDSKILDGLGELVDDKQKSWIKNELKTGLIFLLKVILDSST